MVIWSGHSLKGASGERWFLLLRAFWGTISLSSWFVSVKFTKFGDAAAIYYSYPAFITLLARIFLKEPFTWFNVYTVVTTVVGILFISGPHYITALFSDDDTDFSHNDMIGIILASVGCFAVSCGNLSIRKLQKTPSPVIVIWFSLFSMISSFILVPIIDEYRAPGDWGQWIMLFGVGGFGVLTQVTITLALKIEHAAPVSILEAFNMVTAFIFQVFVFHQSMNWESGVGAGLIAVAVFSIGIKKFIETSAKSNQGIEDGPSSPVDIFVTEIPDCDLPPEYSPPPIPDYIFRANKEGTRFEFPPHITDPIPDIITQHKKLSD